MAGRLWSGRALGDRYPNQPLIAMSRTYDGVARWRRGLMTTALGQPIYSEPDVVTRPDGTWVMFARNSTGGLSFYDARPGAYTPQEPRRSRPLTRRSASPTLGVPRVNLRNWH